MQPEAISTWLKAKEDEMSAKALACQTDYCQRYFDGKAQAFLEARMYLLENADQSGKVNTSGHVSIHDKKTFLPNY